MKSRKAKRAPLPPGPPANGYQASSNGHVTENGHPEVSLDDIYDSVRPRASSPFSTTSTFNSSYNSAFSSPHAALNHNGSAALSTGSLAHVDVNGRSSLHHTDSLSSQPLSYADSSMCDDSASDTTDEPAISLDIRLPSGEFTSVSVEPAMPMMNLLVQVAKRARLNPANHKLYVPSEDQSNRPIEFKANQTVGSLGVTSVHLIDKVAEREATLKKAATLKTSQPFEMTYRMTINLPHGRKMVIRVNPQTPLNDVFTASCAQHGLDPAIYAVQSTQLPGKPLNVKKKIQDLQINEITLVPKSSDSHRSLPDLRDQGANLSVHPEQPMPEYMPTEQKKKKSRIFSFFSKRGDRKLKLNETVDEAPSKSSTFNSRSSQQMKSSSSYTEEEVSRVEKPRPVTMYAEMPREDRSASPATLAAIPELKSNEPATETQATPAVAPAVTPTVNTEQPESAPVVEDKSKKKLKLSLKKSSSVDHSAQVKQASGGAQKSKDLKKKRAAPKPPGSVNPAVDVAVEKQPVVDSTSRSAPALLNNGDHTLNAPPATDQSTMDARCDTAALDASETQRASSNDSFDVKLNGSLLNEIRTECSNKDIVLDLDSPNDASNSAASKPHKPHSRNSSDSSGYHEATMSETGSPEVSRTLPSNVNLKTNSLESTSTENSENGAKICASEVTPRGIDGETAASDSMEEHTLVESTPVSVKHPDEVPVTNIDVVIEGNVDEVGRGSSEAGSTERRSTERSSRHKEATIEDEMLMSIPSLRSQYVRKEREVISDEAIDDDVQTFIQEKSDAIDKHRKAKFRGESTDIKTLFNDTTPPRTEPVIEPSHHTNVSSERQPRPCAFVAPPPPPDTPPPLSAEQPVTRADKTTSVCAESPSLNNDDSVYTFPSQLKRHDSSASDNSHLTVDMNNDFEQTIAMATELWGDDDTCSASQSGGHSEVSDITDQMTSMTTNLKKDADDTPTLGRRPVPLHHTDSFYSDSDDVPGSGTRRISKRRTSASSDASTASVDSQERHSPGKSADRITNESVRTTADAGGDEEQGDHDASLDGSLYSDEEFTTIVEEVIFTVPAELYHEYKKSGRIPDLETAKEHRVLPDHAASVSLQTFPDNWDQKDETVVESAPETPRENIHVDALKASRHPDAQSGEFLKKEPVFSYTPSEPRDAVYTAMKYSVQSVSTDSHKKETTTQSLSNVVAKHTQPPPRASVVSVKDTSSNHNTKGDLKEKKEATREEFVFSRDDLDKVSFVKPEFGVQKTRNYGVYAAKPYHGPRIELADKPRHVKPVEVVKQPKDAIVGDAGTVRGVKGSVKNKCDRLEFKPTNDGEVENVLEEKSISLLNLPARRTSVGDKMGKKDEQEVKQFTSKTKVTLQKSNTVGLTHHVVKTTPNTAGHAQPSSHSETTLKAHDYGSQKPLNEEKMVEKEIPEKLEADASETNLQQQMAMWQQKLLQNQAMLNEFRIKPDDQQQQMQQLQMQLQLQQQMWLTLQQSMMNMQQQPVGLVPNPALSQPAYGLPNQPMMYGLQPNLMMPQAGLMNVQPNLLNAQPNFIQPQVNFVNQNAAMNASNPPAPYAVDREIHTTSASISASISKPRAVNTTYSSPTYTSPAYTARPGFYAQRTNIKKSTMTSQSAPPPLITPASSLPSLSSFSVDEQASLRPSSMSTSRVTYRPKSREGDKRFEKKLTPREELMISIKNAGGLGSLNSVSVAEAHWSTSDTH